MKNTKDTNIIKGLFVLGIHSFDVGFKAKTRELVKFGVWPV